METLKTLGPKIIVSALLAICVTSCSREGEKAGLLDRANNYFKAGAYDSARIEYLNLLRLDPRNATAIEQLGTIWFEGGAPFRAWPFLLKVKELDRKSVV